MFLLAIFFTILGGILTIIGQAYFIYNYFWKNETDTDEALTDTPEDAAVKNDLTKFAYCKLPPNLLRIIESAEWKGQVESCLALNLFFNFLFREWKDTIEMRRWVMRKLSAEFLEMQRTATGRLLDKITVRDLQLGGDLPIIKTIEINSLSLNDKRDSLDTLDLCLDVEYQGNFQLAVDVDLVLGRSASLSVSVVKLQGKGRLQVTRKPFSHWSFAFYEEPVVEFLIESQFQGRQLPQIKSLIINQIRRALRKKHTLPNYKIRFRPFLPFPSFPTHLVRDQAPSNPTHSDFNLENILEDNEITENSLEGATLESTVLNCTRLQLINGANKVFCSLSLDATSWVGGTSSRDSYSYHRLEMERVKKRPLGLTFKQQFVEERCQNCVVIDSVLPNSPASKAGFLKNDVVVAAEGITISNTKQLVKTLKMADNRFYISIERKIEPLNLTKDDKDSSDDLLKDNNGADSESLKNPNSFNFCLENLRRTNSVDALENPCWNERFLFDLNSECLCLNIGVWCQTSQKKHPTESPIKNSSINNTQDDTSTVCDILIGHASVPLLSLIKECSSTTQGSHLEVFRLVPPNSWQLDRKWQKLSLHRGFDWRLCCGDITLYFRFFNNQTRPSNPKIRGRMNEALQKANAKFLKTEDKSIKEKDKLPPAKKLSLTSSSPIHLGTHLLKPDANTTSRSATDSEDEISQNSSNNSSKESTHDFISAHFHSTANCDFCQKKIWLKTAYQCRLCSMICHKKCVNKCKLETSCDKVRKSILDPMKSSPEVPTNSSKDNTLTTARTRKSFESISPISCRKNLNALLSNIAQTAHRHQHPTSPEQIIVAQSAPPPGSASLSRSGSTCNLALPNNSCFPTSKSLPPSPYHSPSQSRKSSLQGSSENTEVSSWLDILLSHEDSKTDDESEIEEEFEDIDGTLELMMKFPHDDSLLALAKEKGKELYGRMTNRRRHVKLERMISKLQEAVDRETSVRNRLAKEEQRCQNIAQKTKLAFLLAKCDQRNQALATLMLLYLSAMQHCCNHLNDEDNVDTISESLDTSSITPDVKSLFDQNSCSSSSNVCEDIENVVARKKEIHTLELSVNVAHCISVTAPSPISEVSIFPNGIGDTLFKDNDENSCLVRNPDSIQLGVLVSNAEEPLLLEPNQ